MKHSATNYVAAKETKEEKTKLLFLTVKRVLELKESGKHFLEVRQVCVQWILILEKILRK